MQQNIVVSACFTLSSMLLFLLTIDLVCRGFADSIFGMSVVFAAIVMYDAQVHCLFICSRAHFNPILTTTNLFSPPDRTC